MQSLRELYNVGRGPSSSHTIAPERAAKLFAQRHPNADGFQVVLYGSLAKTGRGHGTDRVLAETLPRKTEIVFDEQTETPHPNTMDFSAYRGGSLLDRLRVYSVGGGEIRIEGEPDRTPPPVYRFHTYDQIKAHCAEHQIRIPQYVRQEEGIGIMTFLDGIWQRMRQSIREGLDAEGELPGGLRLQRKAGYLLRQRHIDERPETREDRIVCAYAYAVSEQSAAGGVVVTAPTCGASGVVPAVLRYMQEKHGFTDAEVLDALATGGIIGNIIKTNASISGAQCGCQAEIGSACCMAAAALAELFKMDLEQIEYAAESAMEHHLGLTCDPIRGLVQIPCIERNAVAAMRAIGSLNLANFLTHTRKISFDMVVETMYQTGKDMNRIYRETSEGGLAKLYR